MLMPSLLLAVSAALAPEALTVREAAALAAGEAPAVARARAETDRARARESAARSHLGPALTLDFGFLSTNDPVDAFGLALKQERFSAAGFFRSDPNHPGSTRDWNGALSAAWSVDLFGAARNEARAAAGATQASERSASRTRDASVSQAVLAFAAARRAQEALALLAALIGPEAARRPLADLPAPHLVPSLALAERDDVAAAELAAKAARDAEKAALAARLPALTVQGRYETHAPRPGDHWGDSASVFGGFRVPLFASGAIDSKVAEARAALLSAQALALE